MTTAPRILAIDDTPIILETFRLLLPPERLETAESVAAARAALARDPSLRIIFTDLNLRGGGIPFIREVKSAYPGRIVIVLSGDAGVITPAIAASTGIFRALEKGDASLDAIEGAIADAERELSRRDGR
jgi:DNA-binding NtrC family response regulator